MPLIGDLVGSFAESRKLTRERCERYKKSDANRSGAQIKFGFALDNVQFPKANIFEPENRNLI